MKVAVISDIHANMPALEAVLGDLPAVDAVICAGDIVGYYPDANETCGLISKLSGPVIRGNHDAYVLGILEPDPARREAYRTDWTRENLKKENIEWLASLPREYEIDCGGRTIKLRHASPWDEETYLYPDSVLLDQVTPEPGQILVFGHTHHPMLKGKNGGYILNPGSVGQPRDWNPKASYAILECESGVVEFRRVKYDISSAQKRLAKLGWNPAMINILARVKQ